MQDLFSDLVDFPTIREINKIISGVTPKMNFMIDMLNGKFIRKIPGTSLNPFAVAINKSIETCVKLYV